MHVNKIYVDQTYVDSLPIKYTDLDNKAWDLFIKDAKFDPDINPKGYFVYHKDMKLYYQYYDKVKQLIRLNKLKKIMSNV